MRKYIKRARMIEFAYRSSSGLVQSKKTQTALRFESTLERDFIYLLEFDPSVDFYIDQPFTIYYFDINKKKRKYTPDFLVQYIDKNKKSEVIEIKYKKNLDANSLQLKPKFDAARNFCKLNNLNFRVITDNEIRNNDSIYLKNVIFILGYRDVFDDLADIYNVKKISRQLLLILDSIPIVGTIKIDELLPLISGHTYFREENIFFVWHLISKRYILCDLHKRLDLNSEIWKS